MLSLAVLAGAWLAYRQAPKIGIKGDLVVDLAIWLVVGGVVGARLFYVFVYEPGTYLKQPYLVFALWQGGLVYYGALIGGFIAGVWFVWKKGLPFWPLADLVAPPLALGYGLVRIGCFLNGCCYGKPTDSFIGIVFPHLDDWARHPTQIYSSLLGFILFLVLLAVQRKKSFDGQVFLLFLILYGVGRTAVESLRENLTVFGPVTVSQLVSVIIIIIAGIFYHRRKQGYPL
jgi:phosphatidylglycerol:prolipoprotein diacylglycerol transferase